jgi:hypothetical protein
MGQREVTACNRLLPGLDFSYGGYKIKVNKTEYRSVFSFTDD